MTKRLTTNNQQLITNNYVSLYSETFMEYAKNPPNRGRIEVATVEHFEENRSCGDSMEVFLRLAADDTIENFAFE